MKLRCAEIEAPFDAIEAIVHAIETQAHLGAIVQLGVLLARIWSGHPRLGRRDHQGPGRRGWPGQARPRGSLVVYE
jgi:hypothetical protein